ncbi:hypothetical protein OXX80_000156 [Metschnikowia pulcherrima]
MISPIQGVEPSEVNDQMDSDNFEDDDETYEVPENEIPPDMALLGNAVAREDLLNQLAEIEDEEQIIDPCVLELINNLKHPRILMQKLDMDVERRSRSTTSGSLGEIEIRAFQHVNTILQFPPCLKMITVKLSSGTRAKYSRLVAKYVLYVAKLPGFDEKNFKIEGVLVCQFLKSYFKESNVQPKTSMHFKYALQVLHDCVGVYESFKIIDPTERASALERDWKRFPNNLEIDKFYREKKSELHLSLLKTYANKDRSSMFQKKYTLNNLIDMMINSLERTGSMKRKDIYDGINASLEFLIGHHLLQRGSNKIALELSDTIFTEQDTANGIVPILGFQFIKGKTMDENSLPGLSGVCRNKRVEICLVTAYTMSLWFRFDFHDSYGPLTGENVLDFMKKSKWYDAKVLFSVSPQSKLHQSISPTYANNLATWLFTSIGMVSAKKTHAGRVTNAENADANRICEAQIRRAGRWKLDIFQSRYISAYAYEFIHFSGGFKSEEPYYIARAIDVPEELQRMVFP